MPLAGTFGNLGRNTLVGPGIANVDTGIEKSFKIRERANAVFRAEFFNVINHANFGLPNTSVLTATGAPNPIAGSITTIVGNARQVQFGLKINF